MKKTNKLKEDKNGINNRKNLLNNNYLTYNDNKDKIIVDLKQKGFNEFQIKDIFDTFNSNIKEHISFNSNISKTINNNKKIETFKINKLSKNNVLLRKNNNSQRTLMNNNNSKSNYLRLNIQTSMNKTRNYELNKKSKNELINNKNQMKIITISKNNEKINKRNNSYSKKYKEERNIKIGKYLKKFNSHNGYVTNINSAKKTTEKENIQNKNYKNNIINKCKLRIIPINKNLIKDKGKIRKRLSNYNNINKLKGEDSKDILTNKDFKKVKINNIETKTNFKLKKDDFKIKINKKQLFSKNPSIKEGKNIIKKCIIQKNKNPIEDKLKILKNNNAIESENKLKNEKLNKKINRVLIPISSNRNRNINVLKIRKQKSEEDDILAKNNTGITEIKVESLPNSSRYTINKKYYISSSQNSHKEYHSKNSNHNFVNINLCKDINNSDIIHIGDKFLTKQNSFPNFKCNISIKNGQNQFNNSCENVNDNSNNNTNKKINNHLIYRSYHSTNNKNIIEDEKNNDIKENNNQIKIYDVGKYKGIIINDKREVRGVMIYNNGARYEGEWKDDKKNGKGIFISSHYFNCENNIGLKYEGEFNNDKFEGYGKALYSNGDKYEGEWKNNKQYGKGTLTNIGGTKYEGEWIDGIIEGNGIYYMNNGDRYEGHFIKNKFNGYGKYFYNNGNWIEGIFKDDRPTSNSILHRKDENDK